MSPPTPNTTTLSHHLLTNPNTPILLDGALATHLESLGASIPTPLWSASLLLTRPSLIQRAHLDYFRAGANVAITASYQASIPGLVEGLDIDEETAMRIVRLSVELAQSARDECAIEDPGKKMWIAGSIGPYGAYLANGSEYTGAYTLPYSAMKDFHRDRIAALIDAGVDVLACETMPSKAEVVALLELLETEFPETESWFTFTLREGDATCISDGTPISSIAQLFTNTPNVVGMGFNCVPDDAALAALKTLRPLTDKCLVVYPNSGESWNAERREWEGGRVQGEGLRGKVGEWWGAGARMIGGCCRVGPGDIGVMGEALKEIEEEEMR